MQHQVVRSADGTAIAFESAGKGPALVLVGGAFCDRTAPTSGTPLAALLKDRFTVISYDRRGRGDSTDAEPRAEGREVEDLAAVLGAVGAVSGEAAVFGNSSGALLAFDAVRQGLPISKLVVYEPPVILDPSRAAGLQALAGELDAAVAGNRRGEAVEMYFTRVMQMPAPAVEKMRQAPMWRGLEGIAHTLSYDLRITARGPQRLEEAKEIRVPTLVLDGGASPEWMREAIRTLARAIPGAQHRSLEGQTHAVDPRVLAQAIGEFIRP